MPRTTQKSAAERAAEIAKAVQEGLKGAETPEQQFAAALLKKAQSLHDERAKNTEATAANRNMLKGMVQQGDLLTPAQAAAVEAVYPTPEKKETPAETPAAAKDAGTPPAKDTPPAK